VHVLPRLEGDAPLGGELHLVAAPGNGPADQPLAEPVRAVRVGGVEERHARVDRAPHHVDGRRVVGVAEEPDQHHRAVADLGHVERLTEVSPLHAAQ